MGLTCHTVNKMHRPLFYLVVQHLEMIEYIDGEQAVFWQGKREQTYSGERAMVAHLSSCVITK